MTRAVPTPGDLEPLIRELHARFADVQGGWVFGSVARGDACHDSDIDLAVLAAKPLDPLAVFELGLQLGIRANRDVDLVDLRRASTVLRKVIVTEGRLAAHSDANACERFTTDSLALYVSLNEERKDLLARNPLWRAAP